MWPRLEDHKYRWELHNYGLAEEYDKMVVFEIIALLIEALKGIGVADSTAWRARQGREPQSHRPHRHLIPQCLTARSAA